MEWSERDLSSPPVSRLPPGPRWAEDDRGVRGDAPTCVAHVRRRAVPAVFGLCARPLEGPYMTIRRRHEWLGERARFNVDPQVHNQQTFILRTLEREAQDEQLW